jgi:hypothetical protein
VAARGRCAAAGDAGGPSRPFDQLELMSADWGIAEAQERRG